MNVKRVAENLGITALLILFIALFILSITLVIAEDATWWMRLVGITPWVGVIYLAVNSLRGE